MTIGLFVRRQAGFISLTRCTYKINLTDDMYLVVAMDTHEDICHDWIQLL